MGRGWVQFIRDDVDGARTSLESAIATTAGLGGSRGSRCGRWPGWRECNSHWANGTGRYSTVERGRALAATSGIVVSTPLLEWTAAQIARTAR